jgi:hypothetical protein
MYNFLLILIYLIVVIVFVVVEIVFTLHSFSVVCPLLFFLILCAVFCLSVVCYFVLYVLFVCCVLL